MQAAPSLLLIEENDRHSYLIREKFRDAFPDAAIFCAKTLTDASRILPQKSWDLVIINEHLPDGPATDFLDRLSARQPFAAVAVLTEEEEPLEIELTHHHGAVELLRKDRPTLDSFVVRIKRLISASKKINDILNQGMNGDANSLFRDPLTGVYNRVYFEETFRREVERTNRYRHEIALLVVDIDSYDRVAKRKGSRSGTTYLKELAGILVASIRSGDIVARCDEHEFMMLLSHCAKSDAEEAARRVLDQVRKLGSSDRFTVSIGVLHHQGHPKVRRPNTLITRAKQALQRAQRDGGSRLRFAV